MHEAACPAGRKTFCKAFEMNGIPCKTTVRRMQDNLYDSGKALVICETGTFAGCKTQEQLPDAKTSGLRTEIGP